MTHSDWNLSLLVALGDIPRDKVMSPLEGREHSLSIPDVLV